MMKKLVPAITILLLISCSGEDGGKSSRSEEPVGEGKGSASLVISSLFNNKMTSYGYDERKAKNVADKLRSAAGVSESKLEDAIAADRLAGGNFTLVVNSLNALATATTKRDLNANVADRAKLEVAYAGVREKQFGLALLMIDDLLQSPNKWAHAAALNLQGIIKLQSGEVADATVLWKKALELNSGDEAVRLNIGLLGLRYGKAETAKKMLSNVDENWFVTSSLVSVDRMLDKGDAVEKRCQAVLAKFSNHKSTLFNCGLFQAQNKGDLKEAGRLISLAIKAPGGPAAWNDEGKKYLESINRQK